MRPKHRVMVPVEFINDWAREQALNVALGAYPDAKCKIGRSNVDVLPLTELTLSSSDIESKGGLMDRRVFIISKTQNFMTSPKDMYLNFDVLEHRDGKDEVLKRFISFIPYMQMDASLSFSVKSTRFNLTSVTADKLKNSDLFVKLNGTGGVGYVTRDDLRKLALTAANQLNAISIVEDPASFSQDLFNNILAQSQTVTGDDSFRRRKNEGDVSRRRS